MHQSNMQHQYVRAALTDLRARQGAFDSFFHLDGGRLGDAPGLRRAATHSVAGRAFWAASQAFDDGDAAGCRELLEYALQLSPDLASGREWSRLTWKRRLGTRAWRLLRPLVEGVRGAKVASGARK
jgi:hypothetical protein